MEPESASQHSTGRAAVLGGPILPRHICPTSSAPFKPTGECLLRGLAQRLRDHQGAPDAKQHGLGVSFVAGDLAKLSAVFGRVPIVAELKARPLANKAVKLFEHLPKLFLVCLCVCGHVCSVFVFRRSGLVSRRITARRLAAFRPVKPTGPPWSTSGPEGSRRCSPRASLGCRQAKRESGGSAPRVLCRKPRAESPSLRGPSIQTHHPASSGPTGLHIG